MTRIARTLAMAAMATAGVAFPFASPAEAATPSASSASAPAASAADDVSVALTRYGPYYSEGTCNYWKYAVQATGQPTSNCFYWDRDCVAPPENPCNRDGWAFDAY